MMNIEQTQSKRILLDAHKSFLFQFVLFSRPCENIFRIKMSYCNGICINHNHVMAFFFSAENEQSTRRVDITFRVAGNCARPTELITRVLFFLRTTAAAIASSVLCDRENVKKKIIAKCHRPTREQRFRNFTSRWRFSLISQSKWW